MGIFECALFANGKDYVLGGWQEISVKSKEFPDNSLHTVSKNRLFHTMDTYTKPVKALIIFYKNQAKMSSPQPFSLSIYDTVLFRLSEEGSFRQRKAHGGIPGSTLQLATPQEWSLVGSGKTLTSFGTTGVNDGTASLGSHSQTKSMGTGPLQIRWLKSTLTHCYFLMVHGPESKLATIKKSGDIRQITAKTNKLLTKIWSAFPLTVAPKRHIEHIRAQVSRKISACFHDMA